MANIQIAVQNKFDGISDDEVRRVVDAIQIQVRRDFFPAWGIDADLTFYPADSIPPTNAWQIVIVADSDAARLMGVHDLTADGLPSGIVFGGTAKTFGQQWSVAASHEILEMLGDPDINLAVYHQTGGKGTLFAYENCDPCEDDEYAYEIQGVKVSDFVFPSWFRMSNTKTTQFDFCNKISEPFQILRSCFISINNMTAEGWHQKVPKDTPVTIDIRGKVGSRRERRRIPRDQWLRSTHNQQYHEANSENVNE